MQGNGAAGRGTFELYLIKPSHYDDDGYLIQWARTYIPSNSLAALYGIATDCADRRVLGPDVDLRITVMDEFVARIPIKRIIRQIKRSGGKGLREAGLPVCIGGFHAAGSLAMLHEPTPEIKEAWSFGLSIFSGEADGRLDELLLDAQRGELKSLYDYRAELPDLEGTPVPFLPAAAVSHISGLSCFDAGRGCPFECSFCTSGSWNCRCDSAE